MELKIFLTGDNHIGLKYTSYPDHIKQDLVEARINNLKNLVEAANKNNCQLFVIAGDLFDKVNIAKKDIEKTAKILGEFSGTVAVMPGNHDFYDEMLDLWKEFSNHKGENTILLNKWAKYNLRDHHQGQGQEQDLEVILYPAYCNQKHSTQNCLDWIKQLPQDEKDKNIWHIGIAHGSLQGLSPDMENKYYNMSERELENIGLDLWLLGHTHIPYPQEKQVRNKKVFNAGTPEPDGLDCRHGGNAWIITIDENKEVNAELIETGQYRFYDIERPVTDEESVEKIKRELIKENPENKIVRLTLTGRVEKSLLENLENLYHHLTSKLAYFEARETIKLRINQQDIEKEYTKGSFPYQILNQLLEEDEDALQLAYDLIRGCKDAN
ncbi:metallophosphoesterase [Alkalicella caledoniensis]|uniref:Metallophosphoesterase n=1 Tax=Alkalicella caledoniensis TaxID=2731377 RepID=A0A7G9WAT0_ALKCA|nr:metallophosphoesterase [Alkalicella caledoniensis]QNO15792.1 metallophosphoesterase [Alkalicella caledoniensis]